MNQFPVYVPKLLPAEENYLSGRRSCQGCGKALAARIVAKAAGAVFPDQLPPQASVTAQSYAYDDLTFDPMLETIAGGTGTRERNGRRILPQGNRRH